MKRVFCVVICASMIQLVFAQDTCNNDYDANYNGAAKKEYGSLNIYMRSSFDDTLSIELNRKTIFSKRVKSQFSIDFIEEVIVVDSTTRNKIRKQNLKIDYHNHSCVSFQAAKGYAYLEIWFINNKWTLNYSNLPPVME